MTASAPVSVSASTKWIVAPSSSGAYAKLMPSDRGTEPVFLLVCTVGKKTIEQTVEVLLKKLNGESI